MAFFDEKHRLTPLEKRTFWALKNSAFQGKKIFFFSAMSESIISRLRLIKFKQRKNWHFLAKSRGLTPLKKNAIFQTLKNCFFLYSERFLSSLKSHQVKLLLVLFDRNQIKKKLTFFGPKAWVNPFGKMRFLGLFFVKKMPQSCSTNNELLQIQRSMMV